MNAGGNKVRPTLTIYPTPRSFNGCSGVSRNLNQLNYCAPTIPALPIYSASSQSLPVHCFGRLTTSRNSSTASDHTQWQRSPRCEHAPWHQRLSTAGSNKSGNSPDVTIRNFEIKASPSPPTREDRQTSINSSTNWWRNTGIAETDVNGQSTQKSSRWKSTELFGSTSSLESVGEDPESCDQVRTRKLFLPPYNIVCCYCHNTITITTDPLLIRI